MIFELDPLAGKCLIKKIFSKILSIGDSKIFSLDSNPKLFPIAKLEGILRNRKSSSSEPEVENVRDEIKKSRISELFKNDL